MQIAGSAVLDLAGSEQTIDSLADYVSSGGTVTNCGTAAAVLTVAPAGATTFSGVIQDGAGQGLLDSQRRRRPGPRRQQHVQRLP